MGNALTIIGKCVCKWPDPQTAEEQTARCRIHLDIILTVNRGFCLGVRTVRMECPRCARAELIEQDNAVFSGTGVPDIFNQIDKCETISDIVQIYRSEEFANRIGELEKLQLDQDREVWAKSWAEDLSKDNEDAKRLNKSRWLCLRLLYVMCDHWNRDDSESPAPEATISTTQILDNLRPHAVERILSVCLVMDRANAWYNMIDAGTNKRGMHWYSGMDKAWHDQFGRDRENAPTINRRLKWLFDCDDLGLQQKLFLVEMMQPGRTPLAPDLPN